MMKISLFLVIAAANSLAQTDNSPVSSFFVHLECAGHFSAYVARLLFLRLCLDSSNLESCRIEQVLYGTNLATHLPVGSSIKLIS
jgi:hypothetical protein